MFIQVLRSKKRPNRPFYRVLCVYGVFAYTENPIHTTYPLGIYAHEKSRCLGGLDYPIKFIWLCVAGSIIYLKYIFILGVPLSYSPH